MANLRQDGQTCAHGVDGPSNKCRGHLIDLSQHYLLTFVAPRSTQNLVLATCDALVVSDRRRRRRHHNHPQPHSPPIYPFFVSPQPLYLCPEPASPPVIRIPRLGSSALSPRRKFCIMCLAAPAYMIPVLVLVYQPMPGLAYAAPQPAKSRRALSQPVQSQPIQSHRTTNAPRSA